LPEHLIDDIYEVLEHVRRGRRRVIHYTLNEFKPAGISEGMEKRVVACGKATSVENMCVQCMLVEGRPVVPAVREGTAPL
jgi:hypothetical protein